MTIQHENWGTYNNQTVGIYTLSNPGGLEIKISTYGGIITSIMMPDRNHKREEITLGFDHLEDYTSPQYNNGCPYFGAIIGRFANRIGKGKFMMDGKEYNFICNNGINHLHGGTEGFHRKVWEATAFQIPGKVGLSLEISSPDMEEGYPGNLHLMVTYTLTEHNELIITYEGSTDKKTHVNFTNHAYFNLTGCNANVENHMLQLFADKYTEVDETSIPTGKIIDVKDTEMDFTTPKLIGDKIDKVQGRGYDHNYIVNGQQGELRIGAIAHDETSGRRLEMYTTEPGVQLYTGNYLDGSLGRGNTKFQSRFGFCLETQHFPDSPNQPSFPSTLLNPNETYHQTTVYKFSVE